MNGRWRGPRSRRVLAPGRRPPAPAHRCRPRAMTSFTDGASTSACAATVARAMLGDQRGGAAVLEDIGELVGLGRGVDRAKTRAGLEHGEDRHHRLPAIVHEDHDAVAALQAAARAARPPGGRTSGRARRRSAGSCRRRAPSCPASGGHCLAGNASTRIGRSALGAIRRRRTPMRQLAVHIGDDGGRSNRGSPGRSRHRRIWMAKSLPGRRRVRGCRSNRPARLREASRRRRAPASSSPKRKFSSMKARIRPSDVGLAMDLASYAALCRRDDWVVSTCARFRHESCDAKSWVDRMPTKATLSRKPRTPDVAALWRRASRPRAASK